jgi:hypothetical protein
MRNVNKPQGKAAVTKPKTALKAQVQTTNKKGNKYRKCPASDRSDNKDTEEEVEEPRTWSRKKVKHVPEAEEVHEDLEIGEEEEVVVEDNGNTDTLTNTEQVSL